MDTKKVNTFSYLTSPLFKFFTLSFFTFVCFYSLALKAGKSQTLNAKKTVYKIYKEKKFRIKELKIQIQSDFPLVYNNQVKKWIQYFQNQGFHQMTKWLSRSPRFIPMIKKILEKKNLPKDLAYLSLIESGLSAQAVSSSKAIGYWQFIDSTAHRYGLQVNWWLDERKNFIKSTYAAASYLYDLYKMFQCWELSASAYNMGENRLKQLIKRHQSKNFWILSQKKDFPKETKEYIPQFIAALLISKTPQFYGFKKVHDKTSSFYNNYEYFLAPGGTDLYLLEMNLNTPRSQIQGLNPEISLGFIPLHINRYMIRVPKNLKKRISFYLQKQFKEQAKFQSSQVQSQAQIQP